MVAHRLNIIGGLIFETRRRQVENDLWRTIKNKQLRKTVPLSISTGQKVYVYRNLKRNIMNHSLNLYADGSNDDRHNYCCLVIGCFTDNRGSNFREEKTSF